MRALKNKDQEGVCLRCGQCCHLKIIKDGKVVITDKPCPNLVYQQDGKAVCTIYLESRQGQLVEIEGYKVRCMTAEEAFNMGALPKDCPYVYYYGIRAAMLDPEKMRELQFRAFKVAQSACETGDWSKITPGPKENCKYCYGRGYEGRDIKSNFHVLCRCINR